MRNRYKEKLKDCLINYLYDYCFNEKVVVIEGGGIKITMDPDVKVEEDPIYGDLIQEIIKSQGPSKMGYEIRNVQFCDLVVNEIVHSKFLTRLEENGFKKDKVKLCDIQEGINSLKNQSFIIVDKPNENLIQLSKKGLKFYENHGNLENEFLERRKSRRAIIISIVSIIIALLTALSSIYFASQKNEDYKTKYIIIRKN
jgi:hypothetical protein